MIKVAYLLPSLDTAKQHFIDFFFCRFFLVFVLGGVCGALPRSFWVLFFL